MASNKLYNILFYFLNLDKDLVNKIVTLSMATSLEDNIVTCNSAGFLCM